MGMNGSYAPTGGANSNGIAARERTQRALENARAREELSRARQKEAEARAKAFAEAKGHAPTAPPEPTAQHQPQNGQQQQQQHDSCASQTDARVVRFRVHRPLAYGDNVAVCGNTDLLGNWDADLAYILTGSDDDVWSAQIAMNDADVDACEFKVLVKYADGSVQWDDGDNVSISREEGDFHSACVANAKWVRFRVHSPCAEENSMLVCGTPGQLGAWKPENALALTRTDGDVWSAEVAMWDGDVSTCEFKVLMRHGDGTFEWEDGENQRVGDVVPHAFRQADTKMLASAAANQALEAIRQMEFETPAGGALGARDMARNGSLRTPAAPPPPSTRPAYGAPKSAKEAEAMARAAEAAAARAQIQTRRQQEAAARAQAFAAARGVPAGAVPPMPAPPAQQAMPPAFTDAMQKTARQMEEEQRAKAFAEAKGHAPTAPPEPTAQHQPQNGQQQQQQHDSCASQTDARVVRFRVHRPLAYGDNVAVCGNTDLLGNWDADLAYILTGSDDDVWSAQIAMNDADVDACEFKVLVKYADGSVQWDDGDNVSISREEGDFHSACVANAKWVRFRVHSPCAEENSMLVCGTPGQLGAWKPENALALTRTDGDVWSAEVAMWDGDVSTCEFKVLMRHGDGTFEWEDGENQRVGDVVPHSAGTGGVAGLAASGADLRTPLAPPPARGAPAPAAPRKPTSTQEAEAMARAAENARAREEIAMRRKQEADARAKAWREHQNGS